MFTGRMPFMSQLIIVMLNIKNVAGTLYKVTECSVTLAREVSRNHRR